MLVFYSEWDRSAMLRDLILATITNNPGIRPEAIFAAVEGHTWAQFEQALCDLRFAGLIHVERGRFHLGERPPKLKPASALTPEQKRTPPAPALPGAPAPMGYVPSTFIKPPSRDRLMARR